MLVTHKLSSPHLSLPFASMFKTSASRLFQTASHIQPKVLQNQFHTTPKMSSSDRPSGLIANKGIELLTWTTPNGHKASILLEELKEAYGKPDYTSQGINIGENIQKEPWFTALGPNGRIPVIIDHDRNSFPVQEGSAILSYLTRHYDPQHHFSFDPATSPDDYSRTEQWVAWQHGGLGPMQGQANHFYRLAKERIPYPTQRYVGETERLFGILDRQLEGRDYLVGEGRGRYTIADIASFSWVNICRFSGVELGKFGNLEAWAKRINERPAVKRGVRVPKEAQITNEAYERRLREEEGFKEKEAELKRLGDEAKEKYGYKYSSP